MGTYSDALSGVTGTGLSNYTITYTNGSLAITPAPLTITGSTTNRVYNGTTQTNSSAFTTSGLLGADSVTAVTGQASGTNVGTYSDALSGATGTGLSNYTITYTNGSLAITPKTLVITGSTTSKVATGLLLTNASDFTASGLVGSDVVSSVAGQASGTNSGTYLDNLTGARGNGLSNYSITYVNGTLEIKPAPANAAATAAGVLMGGSAGYTAGSSTSTSALTSSSTTTSTTTSDSGSGTSGAGSAGLASGASGTTSGVATSTTTTDIASTTSGTGFATIGSSGGSSTATSAGSTLTATDAVGTTSGANSAGGNSSAVSQSTAAINGSTTSFTSDAGGATSGAGISGATGSAGGTSTATSGGATSTTTADAGSTTSSAGSASTNGGTSTATSGISTSTTSADTGSAISGAGSASSNSSLGGSTPTTAAEDRGDIANGSVGSSVIAVASPVSSSTSLASSSFLTGTQGIKVSITAVPANNNKQINFKVIVEVSKSITESKFEFSPPNDVVAFLKNDQNLGGAPRAKLATGDDLPDWIKFDPQSFKFLVEKGKGYKLPLMLEISFGDKRIAIDLIDLVEN